jgi:hypothetical protein
MSAFDDLKLAMIPTAWKDGKLYSAIPEEVISENLISNGTFDDTSYWITTANVEISSGTVNFNSGGSTEQCQSANIDFRVNKIYRIEYEVKNYVSGSIRTRLQTGSNTIGTSRSANGVYVEYLKCKDENNNNFQLFSTSFVGSVDNVKVQLLNNGDFHFARGTTGTRVYSSGLLQTITDTDAPRLDYTGGGAPSVLLEPQRKNFVLNSNNPAMMNYNGGAGTLGFSSTLSSPDGSNTNSMELNPDGTSSQFWVGMGGQRYDTMTASTVYTASCFVNYDNYRYVRYGGIFGSERAIFDLEQETVVSQEANVISARVESYYQNWKRIIVKYTFQNQVGNGTPYIVLQAMSSSTSHIHSPATTLPMHSYGWQVEEASYPTSYIATSGTAVTRSRDIFSEGGYSELFNDSQGTLYVEAKVDEDFDGLGFVRLRSSNGHNVVDFYFQPNNIRTRQKLNNSWGAQNQIITEYVNSKGNFFKVAVTYNSNGSRKIYFNGSQIVSATNSGDFTTSTGFDLIDTSGSTLGVDIKGVYYFDRELTNAELTSLTT